METIECNPERSNSMDQTVAELELSNCSQVLTIDLDCVTIAKTLVQKLSNRTLSELLNATDSIATSNFGLDVRHKVVPEPDIR